MRPMTSRLPLLALLGLAGCSFPTEGVPLEGSVDADTCVPVAETCDGTDEDCDGTTDEGFASGDPCDGDDADLCTDDMMVCGDAGAEVCGDTSGDDDVELCNGPGLDEDCDGNFDEGFALAACDGADSDLCTEGTGSCSADGLGVVCSDATGDIVETCDGTDQDCDGTADNGFDVMTDEANCGECDNPCTNANGTTECLTGNCTPSCTTGSAQCNGDPDDGCELQDTAVVCTSAPPAGDMAMLTVDGDDFDTVPRPSASTTGTSDRFVRIRIREGSNGSSFPITGTIALVSGAGTDFDLFVYCTDGTTPSMPLSTATLCAASARTEGDDTVDVGRADDTGDRSFDVIAEVRYKSGSTSTTCNVWTLTVTGNPIGTVITNRCGDPPPGN